MPEKRAGANDLVGFIDAPEMNARKNMSRLTIPSIAILPKRLKPLV
jgi:hypothetical protein